MSFLTLRRAKRLAGGTALTAAILAGAVPVAPTIRLASSVDDGSVRIGSIDLRGSWWNLAVAQVADTVVLESVSVETADATYRMPRVEFLGASLPRADLQALLIAGTEPPAARLARLSAREIRIPELVVEQTIGPQKQTTRYRDVVARDIVNGRIASVTSPSGSVETTGDDQFRGSIGRMQIDGFDLAETARFYSEKGDGRTERRTLYASVTAEALNLGNGKGVGVTVGRVAVSDFTARPLAEGWTGLVSLIQSMEAADKVSETDQARLMRGLADMADAFAVGRAEMTGLEIKDPDSAQKGVGRIARMSYVGGAQPEMRMEGFDVAVDGGSARIASISFSGYSFQPSFEALKVLADKPAASLEAEDFRRFIPTFGTMRLSGLAFDLPDMSGDDDDDDDDTSAERIRFDIGTMEVTADRPINGVPTNLRLAVDGLAMPVPADSENDSIKRLADLGYGKIDLSMRFAASWNEARNEIAIDEVSLRGVDMGSAHLRGTIANVTRDAFNADTAVATVALIGAAARSVELTVENKGLLERAVRDEAKRQKRSPDQIRTEWGSVAAVGIPAMLGNSPSAKAVGQAVARFVAKPGTLTVTAKAKDPAGIGLADVSTIGQPKDVLRLIDLSATVR